MAFKHIFFDLDFRNDSITAQAATVDTFFQAHTIEYWSVGHNEVMVGTYDEDNTTGATRFTIFDAGVGGIKPNLPALNSNGTLATFVAANEIIKMGIADDRILLIQYKVRV